MVEQSVGPERLEDTVSLPEAEEEWDLLAPPFRRPRLLSLRNLVATVLVGAAIAALVWFFNRPGTALQSVTPTASASGPAPEVGEPAPDFSVMLLNGSTFQLSDVRGEAVWVNVWATWCPPCRAEMPDIQAVHERYKDRGLRVVALSMGESRGDVKAYAEKTGLTFDIGLDSSTAVAAEYRVRGIPAHFFIDERGVMREIRFGALNEKGMEERVVRLLEGDAP